MKYVYLINFMDEKYGTLWPVPNRKLRLVHVTDPTYVPFVSESMQHFFTNAVVAGDHLYLTEPKDENWATATTINHVARTWLMDATNQRSLSTIGNAWTYDLTEDADYFNGHLFIANGVAGVKVLGTKLNDEITFTEELVGFGGGMEIEGIGIQENTGYVSHTGGLSVYDFSDINNAVQVYDSSTVQPGQVSVKGGTLVISAGNTGAYIYDISNANQPSQRALLPINNAHAADLSDQTAFIVDLTAGSTSDLTIVDISGTGTPQQLATFDWPDTSNCIDVVYDSGIAYLLCGGDTVVSVDVSNPAAPIALPDVVIPGANYPSNISVGGGLLFVSSSYSNPDPRSDSYSLFVADITVPGYPVFTISSPMAVMSEVLVDDSGFYVDTRDDGFCKIDITNPGNIQKKNCILPLYDTPYFDDSYVEVFAKVGDYVLVDKLNLGLRAIRVEPSSLVTGSVNIESGASYVNNSQVFLDLDCQDPRGACSEMRFSNDGYIWSSWQPYSSSTSWQLDSDDGVKTVYVQFSGSDMRLSETCSDSIYVDKAPPSVGIDFIPSTVFIEPLTISGTRGTSAVIGVVGDTAVTINNIVYPTSTTWAADLTTIVQGQNNITVTATDAAGNASSAYKSFNFDSIIMTVALYSTIIQADEVASVTLNVDNLPTIGGELIIEQIFDTNNNGLIDTGEPLLRLITVMDGSVSSNPNVMFDTDSLADGKLQVVLSFEDTIDLAHVSGNHLIRVTSGAEVAVAGLQIGAPPVQLQRVSGVVTDGVAPVPGAILTLQDPWERSIASTVTDNSGGYQFEVPAAGNYLIVAIADDLGFNKAVASPITVNATDHLFLSDIELLTGVRTVSGQVYNLVGSGIGGVRVVASSSDHFTTTMTDINGDYSLSLPEGDYQISLQTIGTGNPAAKGFVNTQSLDLSVTGDLIGINFGLETGDIIVSGRVSDSFNSPKSGVTVAAFSVSSGVPVVTAITDANGAYSLAITAGSNWTIGIADERGQVLGIVGTFIDGFNTAVNALTGNNLTVVDIDGWVAGTVTDQKITTLKDVAIIIEDNTLNYRAVAKTAADGAYHFGVFARGWQVDALVEDYGFNDIVPVPVTAVEAGTVTVDFIGIIE